MGASRPHDEVSREFGIVAGVRQGDVLAPVSFDLFFDVVIATTMDAHRNADMRMLCKEGLIKVLGGSVSHTCVHLLGLCGWETGS